MKYSSIVSSFGFCVILVTGRKRLLRLFSGETHRTPRHCVLRIAQEGKANHISSHVPSYRDANDIVGRYEILSRRSRHLCRYVRIDNNVVISSLVFSFVHFRRFNQIKITRANFDMWFLLQEL